MVGVAVCILLAIAFGLPLFAVFVAPLLHRRRQQELVTPYVQIVPSTPAHRHSKLIPVESSGEIVAYICGTCDDQVDLDDPAVLRQALQKTIDEEWSKMTEALEVKRAPRGSWG